MDDKQTRFQKLLEQFKELNPLEVVEPTIFSIGSRGYYENPTTDILAFFCNVNGQHKLGNTVLQALFDCISDVTRELSCTLITSPEREVLTKNFKRIDLLLEGPDWVIVLENKIYHQQNNPFADYQNYIENDKKRFGTKNGYLCCSHSLKSNCPAIGIL